MITIFILLVVACQSNAVHLSTCNQSTTRTCALPNQTEYLLSLKKGGSDILSEADYDPNFMLCEEYNFNCGYIEQANEPISISNGINLEMSNVQLAAILPNNTALRDEIKPYLNATNGSGSCFLQRFPLNLNDTFTQQFFDAYMNKLTADTNNEYSDNKKIFASNWSNLNINIKTAIVQAIKNNPSFQTTPLWQSFLNNDFIQMISLFKQSYNETKDVSQLHSAYLIDSVTSKCSKRQSINFLVDESGSIGAVPFQNARNFLSSYISSTTDDPSLMSVNFFDSTYDPYLGYGNNKSTLILKVQNKPYRSQGTKTGLAINASTTLITSQNFPLGLPKILVVLTDGASYDSVVEAANNARAKGITLLCVGIGSNINSSQLLQIAGTTSNIISIKDFDTLPQLVSVISNYFCKQMINVQLNSIITGNIVKQPSSPSFFRVEKSAVKTYQLTITYDQDPLLAQQSLSSSEYNPFPDEYSQTLQSFRPDIYNKVYFIPPINSTIAPYKKTQLQNITSNVAYVAIAGKQLQFNLSLMECTTIDCEAERANIQKIGSKSYLQAADKLDTSIVGKVAAGVAVVGVLTGAAIIVAQNIINRTPQVAQQIQRNNREQSHSVQSNRSNRSHRSNHNDQSNSNRSRRSNSKQSKNSGKNKKEGKK